MSAEQATEKMRSSVVKEAARPLEAAIIPVAAVAAAPAPAPPYMDCKLVAWTPLPRNRVPRRHAATLT